MAQAIGEAREVASGKNKDVPWYHAKPEEFEPGTRELFENYSHVPAADVDGHVMSVREKAWAVYGLYLSRNWKLDTYPVHNAEITKSYPRVLALLRDLDHERNLLDIGCCFAQDIRKLIYDGVPSDRLYGTDFNSDFLELGYELFADKETCAAHFFAANVFQDGEMWDRVRGKMDFIHLGNFLHLFSWDNQLKICKRAIEILKPQKGSIVFGRQTGNLKAQEVENAASGEKDASMVWRHDAESFKKLWHAAAQETGTQWKLWAELDTGEGMGVGHWSEPGLRRLRFEVERIE
ncbi:MAG: hypothetical protein Q9191_000619 [Dirinaria sp. TL-2023a]